MSVEGGKSEATGGKSPLQKTATSPTKKLAVSTTKKPTAATTSKERGADETSGGIVNLDHDKAVQKIKAARKKLAMRKKVRL